MASTVRQDPVSNASGGSSSTEAATITGIATGSLIHAWGTHDIGGGTPTITCSDGVAYTNIPELDVSDTTNVQRIFAFYKEGSTSGNKTVTFTFSFAVIARGICLEEIDGVLTSGALDKRAAQLQATPTTGTDATTSGSTGALNKSPNIVLALSMCNGGSAQPAAGTGFSSPNATYTIWNFGGGLTARVENKNTSALTAVAGTFTAAGNTAHLTAVVVYDDIGSAGASVTTLDNEKLPTRPLLATINARQQELWSLQPLGASQPVKSFLATEAQQPRRVPPIQRAHQLWDRQAVAAAFTAGSWVATQDARRVAWAPPPRVLQTWERRPLVPTLSFLPQDEAQVVRPRRSRRWAPMGSLARAAPSNPFASFSLAVEAGGRFLTNLGTPWPMMVRTVWGMVGLSVADYKSLIDDTAAKGYTAVEISAIHHDSRSTWVPFDGAGNLPFSKTIAGANWTGTLWPSVTSTNMADFTTPVTAYWNRVRDIVDYAATKGLVVFFFGAYHGIGGDDGWMNEMMENGLTRLSTHGAYVANLLKTRTNVVHGIGGDYGTAPNTYNASQLAAEQGYVQGLLSVGGQASTMFGAEWNTESIGADQTDFLSGGSGPTLGDTLTIQTYYSFTGDVVTVGRRAYGASPTKPAVMQECPFEDEGPPADNTPNGTNDNGASTRPVRRYHWMALLSGIAGYNAGEAYIWRTNPSGSLPGSDNWANHTNSTTAQDDALLNALYKSYHWWLLVPSGLAGMRTLVAAGASNQSLTAACASDGTILLVYSGPDGNGGQFTVDLRSMNNNSRARWWNPSTGAFSTGGGAAGTFSLSNTASAQSFTPPGANGSGFNDWVLVIDA